MASSADDRLGLLIKKAEQALMAEKSKALRPLGLTVPQYAALLFLAEDPGMSSAALARRVLVTPQSMGPVLAALEGRSLVERRPHRHHRHVIEYFVTPEGRALLRKADRQALRVEHQLAAGLSIEQAKELRELLEQVIDNLSDSRDASAAA